MHLTGTRTRVARMAVAAAALVALAAPAMARADTSAGIFDYPSPVQEWGYAPATLRIQANNWVTWSNDGQDVHTVTATDGTFDSFELAPSEGFSWYFDAPGTYEYFCTLHEWMKARVEVEG